MVLLPPDAPPAPAAPVCPQLTMAGRPLPAEPVMPIGGQLLVVPPEFDDAEDVLLPLLESADPLDEDCAWTTPASAMSDTK